MNLPRRDETCHPSKMMLGTIPLVIADPDRDRARHPSDAFRTIEDLEGLSWAGDRDDLLGTIAKFANRGLDLVVLDLRLQFNRFWEQVELLAEWVLPEFD